MSYVDGENRNRDNTDSAYREAQESLIGTLMVFPSKLLDVSSMIEDDDLANAQCRHIYKAMREVLDEGSLPGDDDAPAFIGMIMLMLERDGALQSSGGQQNLLRLFELGETRGAMATVETYARTVKDIAAKNRAVEVFKEAAPKLRSDSGKTARATLEDASHSFSDILGGLENVKTSTTLADYYDTFVKDVKQRRDTLRESGDDLQASGGIPTGFESLDKMTYGWQRGSMVSIAAKTGVGKSTTAIDIALAAARANASVLLFSMEMPVSDIVSKFVSCDTQISTRRIKTGRVSDSDLEKIEDARKLTEMKIKIDTYQGATIDYIRAQAQKLAQSESGLDMIIIDYLGLIKYRGRFSADRQNQVAETSSHLKELAMSLDIPVIVMSQLINRDRGEDAEQEPTLAMIRESGAIANDSDVIILLHRPSNGQQGGQIPPTKFIVAKNRMGDRGSFLCRSRLDISRFDEIPKDGDGDFGESAETGSNPAPDNSGAAEPDNPPDAVQPESIPEAGGYAGYPEGMFSEYGGLQGDADPYDDHDVITGSDDEDRDELARSIFGDE